MSVRIRSFMTHCNEKSCHAFSVKQSADKKENEREKNSQDE
jgi:hypothetical protein